jgi:glycine betaine/proline transport system permease protein
VVFAGFDLLPQAMQTLALMLVSIGLALLVGVPLGMASGVSDRFERLFRPVLDVAQTMPAFVYLVPVVLFFGIARVPAVIATFIYALPPVIRLISLGIRSTPGSTIDAANAFGATWLQKLLWVQLPQALQSFLAGISQTIMMALGMVVIAAMVGAGGLGREVYVSLQRLQVGQAMEAGIAIVLLAIVLDRAGEGLALMAASGDAPQKRRRALVALALSAVGVGLVLMAPEVPQPAFGIREPVNAGVAWMRDNASDDTQWLGDQLTIYMLSPLRELLTDVVPWLVVATIWAVLGALAGGWRMAIAVFAGMAAIGALGMWEPAMDTLSQILVTIPITVLIALPLGILASQYGWARAILRPINDFWQTIPTFVFLVPVIMLFDVGRVPALIASALYAIPVGIRLVELGMMAVSRESMEAARAFGASRSQTIRKVQLPLARPSLLLGLNQVIMMVLAMVVIAGMVGGDGLGLVAVSGLSRSQTGRGTEAGLAIVILAIIMDRITQAWSDSSA